MPKKKGKKKNKNVKDKAASSAAGSSNGTATKPTDKSKELPKKFQSVFSDILKCYENKKYAKGLKLCATLLKKFPMHGQTIAMKGLITYYQDGNKKAEAFDLAKKGLALDMQSHVCWHVYGLLYRADGNYPMAIKSYSNAIRIDPKNAAILRDLALLQGQHRDFHGYAESRRKLLTLQPKKSENWAAYSVANHLDGKHRVALHVIDQYIETLKLELKSKENLATFEISEIALYRSLLHEAMGDDNGALDALGGDRAGHIVDHLGWYQKRGELLLRLGRYDEARHIYQVLLETNPENYDWHRGLQCCLLKFLEDSTAASSGSEEKVPAEDKGVSASSAARPDALPSGRMFGLPVSTSVHPYWKMSGLRLPCSEMDLSDAQVQMLTSVYDKYAARFPKVEAFKRIPLNFTRGDSFRSRMDAFLRKGLQRNVPSLFSDSKATFSQAHKRKGEVHNKAAGEERLQTIKSLAEGYLASLRSTPSAFADGDRPEPPMTLLFCLVFNAQLQDYLGNTNSALTLLDEAEAHTPTMLDLYKLKARVYKHGGDIGTAALLMDQAREMDKQDRYINTKHVKYLFRADKPEQAVDIASLFTKDESGDDGSATFAEKVRTFYEMQVIWMELEEGASRLRTKDFALALKRFISVHEHFQTFYEDQFDFHSYCMRKSTIRAYMGMVEMVDDMHNRPRYREASRGAVRAYCALYDEEKSAAEAEAAGEENEVTRAVVLRRAQASEAKAADEKQKAKGGKDASQGTQRNLKDVDPQGALRVSAAMEKDGKGPYGLLEKAWELIEDLRKNDPSDVDAALLAFDTAARMKKPMLQLRACIDLQQYAATPSQNGETALRIVRLASSLASVEGSDAMKALLKEQLDKLMKGSQSVKSFAHNFAESMDASTDGRVSAAEFLSRLPESVQPDGWQKTAETLLSGLKFSAGTPAALSVATRAISVLDKVSTKAAVDFSAEALKIFPLCVRFGAKPPGVVSVSGDTFYADGRVELTEEHQKKKDEQESKS